MVHGTHVTSRHKAASATRDSAARGEVSALALVAGLPVLSGTMLAVALPDVAESLQASPGRAVLIVTVYLLVVALTQPWAGAVADRVGRQQTIRLGLGVVVLGSLLAVVSRSLMLLIVARGIQALGSSLVLPGIHAQLVRGRGYDGRRFGLLTAVSNLVAAVGPLIGGLLVAHTGWQGIFVTTGLLAGAAILTVPNTAVSASDAPEAPLPVPVREVLGDRRVVAAAGLNGIDNVVLHVLLIGLPFALDDAGELAGATAMATLTLAAAAMAPIGGRIADRAGYATAARLGFGVAIVGLVALHGAGASPGPGVAAAAVAITGAGLGLEFPSLQAAPLRLVSADRRAKAAGLMGSARLLGSVGGATLVGAFAALGPAVVFGVGAGAAMVGLALAGTLEQAGRAHPSPSVWGTHRTTTPSLAHQAFSMQDVTHM